MQGSLVQGELKQEGRTEKCKNAKRLNELLRVKGIKVIKQAKLTEKDERGEKLLKKIRT